MTVVGNTIYNCELIYRIRDMNDKKLLYCFSGKKRGVLYQEITVMIEIRVDFYLFNVLNSHYKNVRIVKNFCDFDFEEKADEDE